MWVLHCYDIGPVHLKCGLVNVGTIIIATSYLFHLYLMLQLTELHAHVIISCNISVDLVLRA